jgi:hypothetical protein
VAALCSLVNAEQSTVAAQLSLVFAGYKNDKTDPRCILTAINWNTTLLNTPVREDSDCSNFSFFPTF